MRILHTADWHLGIDLHKISLIQDQAAFMAQLKEIILNEEIDVIIIAGDVYDTTLASKEAIEVYNSCMKMICLELQKQVIIIAGNHDSAVRLSTCKDLLAPMGLHVYGRLEERVKPLEIEDVLFYPIPYLHPAQVGNLYDVKISTQQEAYQVICDDLRTENTNEKTKICIAHTFVAGASLSESDRFASVGGSDLVPADVFKDFDYVALGHLHRKQQVAPHVYYSGSPLAYSFAEAAYDKKVLIYDTNTKEVSEINISPLHPLITLQGDFETLQKDMEVDDGYPSSFVKIQVEDTSVSYEMLDYFNQHYPNLLQLSGKNERLDSKISLEMNDLEQLDDVSIVKQYFKDIFDETITQDEIDLFHEALIALQEEA